MFLVLFLQLNFRTKPFLSTGSPVRTARPATRSPLATAQIRGEPFQVFFTSCFLFYNCYVACPFVAG